MPGLFSDAREHSAAIPCQTLDHDSLRRPADGETQPTLRVRASANVLPYHTNEGEGPAPARPACLDFLNLCQPCAGETFVKPNALRQPQGTKLYRRGEV